MKTRKQRWICGCCALFLAVSWLGGCGRIADPDRIRVARMDGEYITRGDLFKLLREMPDKERPKIRNKGDFLRVLNQYIDTRIKLPLGQQLASENRILVSREEAREMYFVQSGDDEEQLRTMWAMELPKPGESTELMRIYNLTPGSLRAMKEIIEQGTDAMIRKMLGDQAVAYLAVEDFKNGKLTLSDEDLMREYRLQKDTFKRFEWMSFLALRFPAALPGAIEEAAKARARIDAGASFESLAEEYIALSQSALLRPGEILPTVMQSEIENNPALARFRGFWLEASGAKTGDILGPVYLPEYQQIMQDAQGQTTQMTMPDAYLVLKVLEIHPETELTFEEAKPLLAPTLLIAAKMRQLREEHGVEIYEDKLPSPTGGAREFGDPMAQF
jgi:hypothetical protein